PTTCTNKPPKCVNHDDWSKCWDWKKLHKMSNGHYQKKCKIPNCACKCHIPPGKPGKGQDDDHGGKGGGKDGDEGHNGKGNGKDCDKGGGKEGKGDNDHGGKKQDKDCDKDDGHDNGGKGGKGDDNHGGKGEGK